MDPLPRWARWAASFAACFVAGCSGGAAGESFDASGLPDAGPNGDGGVPGDARIEVDAAGPDARASFNFGAPCDPLHDLPDAGDGGDAAGSLQCSGFAGARCLPFADGGACSILCTDHDWALECAAQLAGSCAPGAICLP